jgi:hypothetical protein
MYLIENNLDKIVHDWTALSSNPAAIHLLEANPDKITIKLLSNIYQGYVHIDIYKYYLEHIKPNNNEYILK